MGHSPYLVPPHAAIPGSTGQMLPFFHSIQHLEVETRDSVLWVKYNEAAPLGVNRIRRSSTMFGYYWEIGLLGQDLTKHQQQQNINSRQKKTIARKGSETMSGPYRDPFFRLFLSPSPPLWALSSFRLLLLLFFLCTLVLSLLRKAANSQPLKLNWDSSMK